MALLISAFEVQTSLSAAAVSHEEKEEEMSAVRCAWCPSGLLGWRVASAATRSDQGWKNCCRHFMVINFLIYVKAHETPVRSALCSSSSDLARSGAVPPFQFQLPFANCSVRAYKTKEVRLCNSDCCLYPVFQWVEQYCGHFINSNLNLNKHL